MDGLGGSTAQPYTQLSTQLSTLQPMFSFNPPAYNQQPNQLSTQLSTQLSNQLSTQQPYNQQPYTQLSTQQPMFPFNPPVYNQQQSIQPYNQANITQPGYSYIQPNGSQSDAVQQETIKSHFSKINIANGVFAEVFHYLFTEVPEVAKSYQAGKHIKILHGNTRFEPKHEQSFIASIQKYNMLPMSKFYIEYKKDNINSNLYTTVYLLIFTTKA